MTDAVRGSAMVFTTDFRYRPVPASQPARPLRVPRRPRLTTAEVARVRGVTTRQARVWMRRERLGVRKDRRGRLTVSRARLMAWRRKWHGIFARLRGLTHAIFVGAVLPNIRRQSPLAGMFDLTRRWPEAPGL